MAFAAYNAQPKNAAKAERENNVAIGETPHIEICQPDCTEIESHMQS